MTLKEFFLLNPRAALAFSGGADSAYLLWAACEAGADVRPYFVKSQFQPAFELEDALRLCRRLGPERCYYCKKRMFGALVSAAGAEGYSLIIDGTNASDSDDDRPGMRAIRELKVRSPLREAGITKSRLRQLSAQAGLFTWDKPSYACLATRIPTGCPLRAEDLARVERGEAALAALGYRNFRLRLRDWGALLQVDAGQLDKAENDLGKIQQLLSQDFGIIRIDPEGRKGD